MILNVFLVKWESSFVLSVSDNPKGLMGTGSIPVVRKVQQQENFLFAEYSVTSGYHVALSPSL